MCIQYPRVIVILLCLLCFAKENYKGKLKRKIAHPVGSLPTDHLIIVRGRLHFAVMCRPSQATRLIVIAVFTLFAKEYYKEKLSVKITHPVASLPPLNFLCLTLNLCLESQQTIIIVYSKDKESEFYFDLCYKGRPNNDFSISFISYECSDPY